MSQSTTKSATKKSLRSSASEQQTTSSASGKIVATKSQLKGADRNSSIKGDFALIDSIESNNNNYIEHRDTFERQEIGDSRAQRATGEPRNALSSFPTTSPSSIASQPHRKLIDSPDCVRRQATKPSAGELSSKSNNNILSSTGPVVVAAAGAALDAFRMNTSLSGGNATSGSATSTSTGKGQKFSDESNNNNNNNNNNNSSSSVNHQSLNHHNTNKSRHQQSSASSSPSNATTATPVSLSLNTIESTNSIERHQSNQQKGAQQDSISTGNQIPSYSSIFMQQQQQQSQQQKQQPPVAMSGAPRGSSTSPAARGAGGQQTSGKPAATGGLVRGPLRKQFAQTDIDEAVISAGKLAASTGGGKKLSAFNFRSSSTMKEPLDDYYDDDDDSEEEDDDDEDDDAVTEEDELSPFSKEAGAKKQKDTGSNKRRISPESSKRHRANINNNPNAKISFGSANQPPSFNTCQNQAASCHVDVPFPGSRKLDWILEAPGCAKCSCNNCYKKRKLIMAENLNSHQHHYASHSPLTYKSERLSKTRTMHLVLKSIILILLTLLLLMILIGALMASHFLPQALDRAINASRSFNVTIAG